MEGDLEEGDSRKQQKLIFIDSGWLDWRETIVMNIILDRLDVVDYIRFPAVCKKWQSVHKQHRIGCSPYPPPLPLPFPWLRCLFCSPFCGHGATSIVFHLPYEQKSYCIPLLKPIRKPSVFNYRHGWEILLPDQPVFIVNLISGARIELPPLPNLLYGTDVLPISHPPSDPDCTAIIRDYPGRTYLNRLNSNNGWKSFFFPKLFFEAAVFCQNNIYCMICYKRVYMIDTLLPDLFRQRIEMDCSEISASSCKMFCLVDYFGELVMANFISEESIGNVYDNDKEFEVYKADFSRNKWVRMKTLGENALFLSSGSRFAVPAVDVGCKKNTIYYAGGIGDVPWGAFDLSSKDWIDGPPMPDTCRYHPGSDKCSWFLPSLDYFGVGKRNGACRIQFD